MQNLSLIRPWACTHIGIAIAQFLSLFAIALIIVKAVLRCYQHAASQCCHGRWSLTDGAIFCAGPASHNPNIDAVKLCCCRNGDLWP